MVREIMCQIDVGELFFFRYVIPMNSLKEFLSNPSVSRAEEVDKKGC